MGKKEKREKKESGKTCVITRRVLTYSPFKQAKKKHIE